MRNRQDTAGFSYALYRPFPENAELVPTTLRDVVCDELLPAAVSWLLGYDAGRPLADQIHDEPIRAQMNHSHWETAWCLYYLTDLIDASRSLSLDQRPLVQEIERRLGSSDRRLNPLVWLLSEGRSVEAGRVRWYGKEYDTAVVTLALLQVKSSRIQLHDSVRQNLDPVLLGALKWLFENLEEALENGKRNDEALQVIEPLIWAATCFPKLWRALGPDSSEMGTKLFVALDRWVSYAEASLSKEQGASLRVIGGTEAHCLCRLIACCKEPGSAHAFEVRRLAQRAQFLLVYYVEYLESSLRDQWGGTLDRTWRLGTYINACQATALDLKTGRQGPAPLNSLNQHVVLKVLATIKTEVFSNGSIFNTVYSTVYFVRALVILLEWEGIARRIIDLYDELLDRAVVGTPDRQVNFELRRMILQGNRELNELQELHRRYIAQERKKRYILLVLVWLSLTVLALIVGKSRVDDFFSFASFIMAVLAVLLYFLEVIFLREPG